MVQLKEQLLMLNLKQFYSNTNNILKIMPILEGQSKISLRSLDWFVTNYSKNKNIIFKNKNTNVSYNVWLDYKSQLKAFSKKNFDPFCRRERIVFEIIKNKYLTTTIGQLNFFKWAIENHILTYVETHIKSIEQDMILIKIRLIYTLIKKLVKIKLMLQFLLINI